MANGTPYGLPPLEQARADTKMGRIAPYLQQGFGDITGVLSNYMAGQMQAQREKEKQAEEVKTYGEKLGLEQEAKAGEKMKVEAHDVAMQPESNDPNSPFSHLFRQMAAGIPESALNQDESKTLEVVRKRKTGQKKIEEAVEPLAKTLDRYKPEMAAKLRSTPIEQLMAAGPAVKPPGPTDFPAVPGKSAWQEASEAAGEIGGLEMKGLAAKTGLAEARAEYEKMKPQIDAARQNVRVLVAQIHAEAARVGGHEKVSAALFSQLRNEATQLNQQYKMFTGIAARAKENGNQADFDFFNSKAELIGSDLDAANSAARAAGKDLFDITMAGRLLPGAGPVTGTQRTPEQDAVVRTIHSEFLATPDRDKPARKAGWKARLRAAGLPENTNIQ